MTQTISTLARQGQATLRTWLKEPRVTLALRWAGCALTGFLLSAASLGSAPLPLVLGLLCAVPGLPGLLIAIGGVAGYPVFWGTAGMQGVIWTVCAIPISAWLTARPLTRDSPHLLSALAAFITAACGLAFQVWLGDETGIGMYLLRVILAAASAEVFRLAQERQDALAQWLAWALCILALAQVVLLKWISLGHIALGVVAVSGAFPAAALGGLALDLASVTPVPMTAAACLVYLLRLFPVGNKWTVYLSPGVLYIGLMALCQIWDFTPLPGLMIGGLLGSLVHTQPKTALRRGSTGVAQVRLEMASEVFAQAQQLLLEGVDIPIDEEALVRRGAERACGSCPARKSCKERESANQMPAQLLHRPLLDGADLPVVCRKPGRLLSELHRAQEQLRSIRADRERQREYRFALIQQYQFISRYLQGLSTELSRRDWNRFPRFAAEVSVSGNRPKEDNGDRCQWFAGVGCRYYVVLCDGMGTGLGAVEEGNRALKMLKRLLCAGYPAEHALRSLNSLCALRGQAGAVTVDLAELQLDSGAVSIYKWGAAPSWLLTNAGAEKIGTATPPPGLSVTEGRETVERLSLRRGEMLLLLSDGVGGEDALRRCVFSREQPPDQIAAALLSCGASDTGDDATVVCVRLVPKSTPS